MMKTISELQQEIRIMQTELIKINNQLSEINDELLNYKDSGIKQSIYKSIYEIAKRMPVIEHPIIRYNMSVKNNYFAILMLVATCGDSVNDSQLLFLQRMIIADKQSTSIDSYMLGVKSITPENVIFKIQEDIKNDLAFQILLDMMIVANIGNIKTRNIFEMIADISSVLGIDPSDVSRISVVSKAVLMQDIKMLCAEEYETIEKNNIQFGYYLQEIKGWSALLEDAKQQSIKAEEERKKQNFVGLEQSTKDEYGDNWFYYE